MNNPYVLLMLASLFWSGNHIVGRAIGGSVPPLAVSTLRWLIPLILLYPFARPYLQRDWPAMRAHWAAMLWLCLTGGALFSALQYVGLQYTSALNVSVLNSLVPVLIVATSALLFRDRVSRLQALGILTSSVGVLAIVTRGNPASLRDLSFNPGDIIIVINMLIFSIYAACLRLRPKIHWLSFVFAIAVVSTVSTAPFAIWEASSGYVLQPTLLTFASVAYVSIFPSVLAFIAWNRGVDLIGANRAGPYLHMVPIFTAVIGSVLLGESIAGFHIVGFILILGGVALASRVSATPPER